MYSILVVGAGKEGKGFIGETFSTEGWKVSFLDKDPKVVEAKKREATSSQLIRKMGISNALLLIMMHILPMRLIRAWMQS